MIHVRYKNLNFTKLWTYIPSFDLFSVTDAEKWDQKLTNIADNPSDSGYVTVTISSLSAATNYDVMVMAVNAEGNSTMVATMFTAGE